MTRRSGSVLVTLAAALGAQGVGAQQPAAPEPRLVAPGIVSTANGEYHPSFHAGRSELFFMRRTPGRFDYTLYVSRHMHVRVMAAVQS